MNIHFVAETWQLWQMVTTLVLVWRKNKKISMDWMKFSLTFSQDKNNNKQIECIGVNHSSSCQWGNVLPQTPQQDYVITTLTVWPWETVSLSTIGNVKENKKHVSDHAHLLLCRLWGYCGLFIWRPLIGAWVVGRHEKCVCLKQKLLFVFCAGLQVHSEIAIYTMCNQATQDFERAMFGSLDVVLSSIRRQSD